MAERRFEVVQDTPDNGAEAPPSPSSGVATTALILALKALSQRALIAIDNLFTLATVGSAFWLWMSIHDPNVYQLVGLGMYGGFVLIANWIVRK